MKRSVLAVPALLSLLAFPALPLHAEDAPKAPATQESAGPKLAKEYQAMADVLKYTPEQREKLAAAVAARDAIIHTWETVERPRWEQIFRERQAARRDNDTDKADTLTKQLQQINAKHGQELKKADGDIYAIMTPEQVKVWDIYNLDGMLVSGLVRADLTDAQKAEIHKRVDAVAHEYLDAKPRGRATIQERLREAIIKEVLNNDQREALNQRGPMGGMRGGGAKGRGGPN